MPNFSAPNVLAVSTTADVDAPDISMYALEPVLVDGDSVYSLGQLLPDNDAKDGGNAPLTGLAAAFCCNMPIVGGVNPYDGLSSLEIKNLAGSNTQEVAVTPAQAGQTIEWRVPNTNPGGGMAFAIFTHDGAAN